ncbi:MAG: thiamine diphosphokinase [Cellulosilyticaceae bacterium]
MHVLILTNGEYGDYHFCKGPFTYDYVICADNGMKHARQLGIQPNLILGDFDSCDQEDLAYFEAKQVMIQRVPAMKDETDTELAIDTALLMGATEIDVFGGVGSRIDHSLGNIHLLKKTLAKGVKMWLYSSHNQITLIDHEIILQGAVGQTISLLPLTLEVSGVTTQGLLYEVEDTTFVLGRPIGVSNEMTASEASISVSEGLLLVIKAND